MFAANAPPQQGPPGQQPAHQHHDSRFTSDDLSRLAYAIDESRLALEPYRRGRLEITKQYAGGNYSAHGAPKDVPVNFMAAYFGIVVRNLIAQNPRVMLSTFDKSMKPMVAAMEKWANVEIDKMGLKSTLKNGVFDSLSSIGIAKVALASPPDAANSSWATAAGKPFAEPIDLDDFVYDIHARDFRQVRWIGHRFRVPLYAVANDSRMDPEARKQLKPSTDAPFNAQGDERIDMIGRGYVTTSGAQEFEDMVDLWEIYIPSRKIVVTLADDFLEGSMTGNGVMKPLLVQDWVGPDCGPYHILGLARMPGSAMPKAPAMDLLPLHLAANEIYRKLLRQCARMKELTFVSGGADEDGTRIMNANDGDIPKVDNPDKINQVNMGGPSPLLMQFFQSIQILFSWLAGNLDSLGGLSPQAKTATQDTMLERNSSRGIADYQDQVVAWTSSILEALCWYWYHDPNKVMTSNYSVPGMPNISKVRQVSPQQRMQGRYEDLDISVDPYSLQHSTPQQRMGMLDQLVTQVLTPMMPLLQQQGISIDINAYLAKKAQYMDMPDLSDIVTITEPPQPDSQPGGGGQQPQQGPQPAQTTRTYVRQNMPGRTMQGDAMNAMNQARGIDPGGNPNKGAAA